MSILGSHQVGKEERMEKEGLAATPFDLRVCPNPTQETEEGLDLLHVGSGILLALKDKMDRQT